MRPLLSPECQLAAACVILAALRSSHPDHSHRGGWPAGLPASYAWPGDTK
jgi:hypothetical protein